MVNFEDIIVNFNDTVVFLDIDGTLVEDGGMNLESNVIKKVEEIKSKNQVYICTNMHDEGRRKMFEKLLSLESTDPNIKKPNRKVLGDLVKNNKKVVVIGDKILTDGILAKRIGAQFIKVKRKTSNQDSWTIKITYIVDDILSKFLFKHN